MGRPPDFCYNAEAFKSVSMPSAICIPTHRCATTTRYNTLDVTYLSVEQPTPEESADPILYANRVQHLLAKELGVSASTVTSASKHA